MSVVFLEDEDGLIVVGAAWLGSTDQTNAGGEGQSLVGEALLAVGAIGAEGERAAFGLGQRYRRLADAALPVGAAVGEYAVHGNCPF